MDEQKIFLKIIPAFITTGLLCLCGVLFTSKYMYSPSVLPLIFDFNEANNRLLFSLNFYVPFMICAVSLYTCLFASDFFIRWIGVIAGFLSAVLCVYSLNDLFSITICIYTAYNVTISISFTAPKNCLLVLVCIPLYIVFLFHPQFLGSNPGGIGFVNPGLSETIVIIAELLIVSIGMILLRFFVDKYKHAQAVINHLRLVERQMVLVNHRLQELAKNRGEEAVKQDRLRFTRDLHDGCGYAFTNIIAVTDAAVSCGDMEHGHAQEIFQRIRNLATEGLRETRETLRLIRSIQEPSMKSIDTIYQLKTVFQEVTGIQVQIEWGNMRHDYGPAITQALARIVQEAFTNSVRHGQATRILLQFWEFSEEFNMTVTDNGVGASGIVKGIGLAGMEERLESVQGKLKVSLPQEGGFRLDISIPL
ncbi:MAG: histidine kinase [Treponema sp.]|jgi:signal transduction histidine kinase|nr:histidine kinase [Treponema sp.]